MSADIGPGCWVQCVALDGDDPHVHIGGVYYVSHFGRLGSCLACNERRPSIGLAGVPDDPFWGFCACQFRPLGGGQSNSSETLQRPAPKREREPERV